MFARLVSRNLQHCAVMYISLETLFQIDGNGSRHARVVLDLSKHCGVGPDQARGDGDGRLQAPRAERHGAGHARRDTGLVYIDAGGREVFRDRDKLSVNGQPVSIWSRRRAYEGPRTKPLPSANS